MANEEHLAILNDALEKQDIEIWNQWRRDKDIQPDLSGADLSNLNVG